MFWYEGINYKNYKKYGYKISSFEKHSLLTILATFFYIFLPSKKEFNLFLSSINPIEILKYISEIFNEIKNKGKLKLYEKIAFYKHKWTNKGFPFYLINFVIKKMKKKSVLWMFAYFIIKILQVLYLPICVLKEYILRILICLRYLVLSSFKDFILPNKL